jgi:hypothetical protein
MASLGWKAHSSTVDQHLKQYPEDFQCGTYTKKHTHKQHVGRHKALDSGPL